MASNEKDYPFISISELKPYPNNARQHPQEQINKIVNSINEFGFITPVIIDENNMILVGHGRTEAAKIAGLDKVPFRRVTNLSDDQKRAYILADNKLSDLAEWDKGLLDIELGNIGLDMSEFGFEDFSLSAEDFGTDFELPSGEKSEICQITFTLHEKQKELIEYAMELVADDVSETFGNTNSNGNKIYEVVRQWAEQRKS